MSIVQTQFEAFLTDVEDRVLGAFATHSFRSAANTSFARGLLRETMQALDTEISRDIIWLAFTAEPYLSDSWFIAGTQEIHERQLPLQVIVPEAVAQRVTDSVAGQQPNSTSPAPTSFTPLDVSAPERRAWQLASDVKDFYVRSVFLHYDIKATTPLRGALVAAARRPLGSALSEVDDAVDHSLACIVDRLRLAQAADSASMRVLASLDDEYQDELIRARQASGLQEFLKDLQLGEWGPPAGTLALSAKAKPQTDDTHNKSIYSASVECLAAFRAAINGLVPPGDKTLGQIRIAPSSEKLLQTPLGTWYGWAEYRYGLGELRLRPVVLAVVGSIYQLNSVIARFIAAAHGRRSETGLVILAPRSIHSEVVKLLEDWKQVINIASGVMPEPDQ